MEPTNIDSQVKSSSKLNKSYIKLLIISLVVVSVAYILFATSIFQKKATGLEVAIKINSFLDKTMKEGGGMAIGFGCNVQTKECPEMELVGDAQPHLGQAIYSYYLLAQATGDNSYRQKSDKVMDFVIESCKKDTEMCAWNFFPLSRYYFDTKDKKYLLSMLVPSGEFLRMNNSFIVGDNVGHKLASLYKATNEDKYKRRLLEVANEELSKWPYGPEVNSGKSIQVIWSVFLPAYEITNDKKYLVASETYFDTFDLSKNFYRFLSLDPIVKGVDALITMSEVSEKGDKYKVLAHSALQELINKNWDHPNKQIINGDYGFAEKIENAGRSAMMKKTVINGWISKSFIRLQNDKFNLPTNDK